MFKNIKLLSISTAMILSSSLVIISCSSTQIKTKSEIKIDQNKLLKNFTPIGVPSKNTFTEKSINIFIDKFNKNPGGYIKKVNQPPVEGIVPFLVANYDHFLIKSETESEAENQLEIKVETSPGPLSTFKSMKFSFGVKSEYEPTIFIESGSEIQNQINSNIASIMLRISLPTEINGKEYKDELQWVEGFFSSNENIYFKSKEAKEAILSLKPSQVITKITNKTQFNKYLKFGAEFPSFLLTGWNFEVYAKTNEGAIMDSSSVKLIFTLSNNYFIFNPPIPDKEIILENLIPENKE